jgi:hypothetical protein
VLKLLVAWSARGAHRLDLNGDGKIDDPGAAIMDAAWPRIADAMLRPTLGPLRPSEDARIRRRPSELARGLVLRRLVRVRRQEPDRRIRRCRPLLRRRRGDVSRGSLERARRSGT